MLLQLLLITLLFDWPMFHGGHIHLLRNPLRAVSMICHSWYTQPTRRALGRVHVPPTKVFPWLAVNATILKPYLAAATGGQYIRVGFSRHNKILRCSAYMISEKAIPFWHLDYNLDRAQTLISSSMSQHLSTQSISSKSMHVFLSTLAHR